MYRIEYERNGVVYPVLRPVDNVYKIFSGSYHRETNGAGKLTFAVRFHQAGPFSPWEERQACCRREGERR